MENPEDFLKILASKGGAIISSSDCMQEEIEQARTENRFYVDTDGYGYVWNSLD